MILHVWIDCSQNFGERWRERMKKVRWSRRLHKTKLIDVWVSKIMINLDSINSNIYSEITFLRWDIIISKKNFSRFYTTFLKSVKCRTILVLTFFSQKGRKKIRPSDSENVKWKMMNPWNPFNAVRSSPIWRSFNAPKNCEKKVKSKGLRSGSLGCYVWRAPVIDKNSSISGCLEVVYTSSVLVSNKRLVKIVNSQSFTDIKGLIWFEIWWSSLQNRSSGAPALLKSEEKEIFSFGQISSWRSRNLSMSSKILQNFWDNSFFGLLFLREIRNIKTRAIMVKYIKTTLIQPSYGNLS